MDLKLGLALLLLVVSMNAVNAACTIAPTTWAWDSSNGSTLTQSFIVFNSGNSTANVSYSVTANPTFYSFSHTNALITSLSSDSFSVTVSASGQASGSYPSTLNVAGDCTASAAITGTVPATSINGWVASKTDYVSSGETELISPINFKLSFTSITADLVKYDLYAGTRKIGTGITLGLGENDTEDDFMVQVIKIYGGETAKIRVYTNETAMALSKDAGSVSCKLQPTWNSLGFNPPTGKVYTDNRLSLKNLCSQPVDIKDISFDPAGNTMWQLPNQGTKTLGPGEDLPVPIAVDATNAEPGQYSSTLVITGFVGVDRISVSIPLTAQITEDLNSPFQSSNPVQFIVPATAQLNQPITFIAKNVRASDDVRLSFTPNYGFSCDSAHDVNSVWTIVCKFSKAGKYSTAIAVSRIGIPIPGGAPQDILVGLETVPLAISVSPDLAKGQKSHFSVIETLTNTPVPDATLTVNGGAVAADYSPDGSQSQVSVCAARDPYQTTCQNFSVQNDEVLARIATSPQYPFVEQKFDVLLYNKRGDPVPNGQIFIDGNPLANLTGLSAGTHRIKAVTSVGTLESDMQLFASPVESDILVKARGAGENVVVHIDQATPFTVFYMNPDSGKQKLLDVAPVTDFAFNATLPGIYFIQSGKTEKQVEIKNYNVFNPFDSPFSIAGIGIPNVIWWILTLFIAYVSINFLSTLTGLNKKSGGVPKIGGTFGGGPSNLVLPGSIRK